MAIVWIQPAHRRGKWLVVAAIAAVAGVASVVWKTGPEPIGPAVVSLARPAHPNTSAGESSPAVTAATASRAAVVPQSTMSCPYQQMAIADGAVRTSACFALTRTVQSGDLRSYLLAPQGVSPWTLRIDAAAGAVLAVSLSAAGAQDFRCDTVACTGVTIGPRDQHGGRRLVVRDAVLRPATSDNATDIIRSLTVNADLQIAPDRQDPTLVCKDASVAVVEADGGAFDFCPGSGGAIAMGDGGRRIFTLRSVEGDDLIIGVDVAGTVDEVTLGAATCRGTACGGAAMVPGADGTAGFVFSGANLSSPGAVRRTTTLNGSAVLPAM